MSTALQLSTSTKKLREKYPNEWSAFERLVRAREEKEKLRVPKDILAELQKELKVIRTPLQVDLPPNKDRPFLIAADLDWEEDVNLSITSVQILPAPGAGAREKKLVCMLALEYEENGGLRDEDRLIDAVHALPEVKALNKRIQRFCDRGEVLREEYDFDFDEFLSQ